MSLFSRHSLSVLLVCRANICRSPMAEALLREELKLRGLGRKVLLDSAGTNASQPGHPADGRAMQVCAREGIYLRKSRARQVEQRDFADFDYIVAMDSSNRDWLLGHCPLHLRDHISLMGSWASDGELEDIPDPYYSSLAGFEDALALLHTAVEGLVPWLLKELEEIDAQR